MIKCTVNELRELLLSMTRSELAKLKELLINDDIIIILGPEALRVGLRKTMDVGPSGKPENLETEKLYKVSLIKVNEYDNRIKLMKDLASAAYISVRFSYEQVSAVSRDHMPACIKYGIPLQQASIIVKELTNNGWPASHFEVKEV